MKYVFSFLIFAQLFFVHLPIFNEFFPPSDEFKSLANIQSFSIFEEAKQDSEFFWARQAANLDWFKPWEEILRWAPPYAEWFVNGKLNACYNCLDIHMDSLNRHKIAIIWEGENGEKRTLTYEELYIEVNKFSHALRSLGVDKGDRIAIYLPMIPETIIAMLACARIGAVHMVIFGGFSATALKDRIMDGTPKVIITADGGFRRGGIVHLKASVDQAIKEASSIQHVVVIKRTGYPVEMEADRDHWYGDLIESMPSYYPPEEMDAEDVLFVLYTSGTTGKPKGIVHTTGGYMVAAKATTYWVFDTKPSDIYWCTADIGWITGHTYIVYGPLSNGMTQLIYEGALDWPQRDRCWQLIENHQVTTLYTAPTVIRTFMKWGEHMLTGYDLSSLRLLGSVGEPINPEAWMWYYTHIGGHKCPIVDTWWQTETGSILIAPLPGLVALKPGSATIPLPGISINVLSENSNTNIAGSLVVTEPWPSMLRGIYNDSKRFEETYWKKDGNLYYFTGDGAKQDEEGYIWLLGRVDDVINVSGHRLGSAEIESALVAHPYVAEAAVVAINHSIKGQAIAAFVSLKEQIIVDASFSDMLKQHVVKQIGAFARPEKIIFVKDLPKTRSGKIMRRLLRDLAEGRVLGDITTLMNPAIIDELKKGYEKDSD